MTKKLAVKSLTDTELYLIELGLVQLLQEVEKETEKRITKLTKASQPKSQPTLARALKQTVKPRKWTAEQRQKMQKYYYRRAQAKKQVAIEQESNKEFDNIVGGVITETD